MHRNESLLVLILVFPVILLGCAVPAVAPAGTLTPALSTPTSVNPTEEPSLTPPAPETVAPTTLPISPTPLATATPTLSPAPTNAPPTAAPAAGTVALNDLKYRLIAEFGPPFFCDPNRYPIARDISDEEVARYVAELQKSPAEYAAILRHLGLPTNVPLMPAQKRSVYAEQVMLNSIVLTPSNGKYQFGMTVGEYNQDGTALTGVIDAGGRITVTDREPAFLTCPICLSAGTLIATPAGQIPVEDVQPGMIVWTRDSNGVWQPVPVVQIVRRPVPTNIALIRITLSDGRSILASPAHPAVDGNPLGTLIEGSWLDGSRVSSIQYVPYSAGWTYDLLPAGDSGVYLANGIWLKSTLSP